MDKFFSTIFLMVTCLSNLYGQKLEINLTFKDSAIFKIDEKSIDSIDFFSRTFFIKSEVSYGFFNKICEFQQGMSNNTLHLMILLNGGILLDSIKLDDPFVSSRKYFSANKNKGGLNNNEMFGEYLPPYPTLLFDCTNKLKKIFTIKLTYLHSPYDKWFTTTLYKYLIDRRIHLCSNKSKLNFLLNRLH